MTRFCKLCVCAVFWMLALTPLLPVRSSQAAGEEQGHAIGEKVDRVLRQWSDHLTGLKSFQVDMNTSMKMKSPTGNMEMESAQQLRVQRPNRMALVLREGVDGVNIFCDGETLTVHVPLMGRYTSREAPDSLSKIAQNPLITAGQQNILTGALLSDDPYAAVLEGVQKARYDGMEEVDGTMCHRLVFQQSELDWTAWITNEEKPVVRRVVPDLSKALAAMGGLELEGEEAQAVREQLAKTELNLETKFTNWKTGATFTDADFAFDAPEDARKVESLFGGLADDEEEGPHPLVGKPAPPIQLDKLDGSTVQLAQHADKDVVILDFWATWCGPCRRAMPTISEVAKRFADKGVVLYAVNLEEEAETVQEFLEAEELDVNVLLDKDGDVAGAYRANAIPQTVIVDKKGIVQVVHVGLLPNLEEQLQEDLEAILAGKNLAQQQLEKKKDTEEPDSEKEPEDPNAE